MNDNYDLCNIKNKSFSNFMNDIGNKHAIDLFGHQGLNLPDLTEPKGQQVCNMSTHTRMILA